MFRKSRAWHCRFCKRRGVRWCLPHTEARKWGDSSSEQGLGNGTFPRERGPEGRASRPFPAASELKSASRWQSVPSESKLLQLGATVHFQDRAFVQRRNAQGGASVVSKEAFGVWTVAQVFREAFCIYSHLHRQNTLGPLSTGTRSHPWFYLWRRKSWVCGRQAPATFAVITLREIWGGAGSVSTCLGI